MKVVLHDRTNGLGQEVPKVAERKLNRLARHFGKVADAEVEFSEERKRSGLTTIVCRINVHLDGHRTPVLHARERAADAQSALDLALVASGVYDGFFELQLAPWDVAAGVIDVRVLLPSFRLMLSAVRSRSARWRWASGSGRWSACWSNAAP